MNREQKERIQYIFLRFLEGEASPEERKELSVMLKMETNDDQWAELLEEIYVVEQAAESFDEAEWKPMLNELIQRNRKHDQMVKHRSKMTFIKFRKMAMAASLIFLVGLSAYLLFFNKTNTPEETVNITTPSDIPAPQANHATITLANGQTVYLDSVPGGQLAIQNGVKVIKTAEGKLVYEGSQQSSHPEAIYNTLTNPRGSKIVDMILADGSHVWLNAGSSVTYPVAFVGNERKVKITGEAYFEIAHDATRPFYVSKAGLQVAVLGTKFNVNTYDDEASIKISLLEGSVKIFKDHTDKEIILKPGQQAEISNACSDCSIAVNKDTDMEQVMAWKNGLFNFDGASLVELLRQLSRWYDVEIIYEGTIPQRNFGGEMQRNLNLSEVLKLLEENNIRFRIEDRKLFILSA